MAWYEKYGQSGVNKEVQSNKQGNNWWSKYGDFQFEKPQVASATNVAPPTPVTPQQSFGDKVKNTVGSVSDSFKAGAKGFLGTATSGLGTLIDAGFNTSASVLNEDFQQKTLKSGLEMIEKDIRDGKQTKAGLFGSYRVDMTPQQLEDKKKALEVLKGKLGAMEKKDVETQSTSEKLKASGAITQKEASKMKEEVDKKYGQAKPFTPVWFAREMAYSTPQLVGSFGVGVVTAIVTKNPALGLAVGYNSSFIQEAGSAYQQAVDSGVDEATAQQVASATGTTNALIEQLPLAEYLGKNPAGKEIQKSIMQKIKSLLVSRAMQGTFEGGTETVQQLVSNALEMTYNEKKGLFEGVPESGAVGFLMGMVVPDSDAKIDLEENIKTDTQKSEGAKVTEAKVQPQTEKKSQTIEQMIEEKGGWKSGDREKFDTALLTKDAETVKNMLPSVPQEYQQRFSNEISDVLGTQVLGGKDATEVGAETVAQKTSEQSLIEEAKKYKSPEEFFKSKGEPLLHGTTEKFNEFDLSKAGTRSVSDQGFAGKGIYLTNSKEVAETFSKGEDIFSSKKGIKEGRIVESFVDIPDSKVLKVENFSELSEKLGLPKASERPKNMGLTEFVSKQSPIIREKALSMGYDAIKVDGGGVDKYGTPTYELVVFDPKNIKTKSQLTEIWNKASKEKTPIKTQKEVEKSPTKKNAKSEPQAPVQSKGTEKQSKFISRLKEQLLSSDPSSFDYNPETGKYNELNLQESAEVALNHLENNPEEAVAVSLGLKEAPKGTTNTAVSIATAIKARDEGNFVLYSEIMTSTSMRLTRAGQEIVSVRGQFNDDSAENYVKRLVDSRMKQLGDKLVTDAETKGKSYQEKVVSKVDKETKKLKERLAKEQIKIKSAQDIIDALRC